MVKGIENDSQNTSSLYWGDDVERAILETLPPHPGTREKRIFEFARALKGIAALRDASAMDLKPYVRRWHKLALPTIGTKPFEETLLDFLKAWPKVKFPKGTDCMATIFAAAMEAELPTAAREIESVKIRHLVALCRELQRAAGEGPFFLSCRTAGRLLGVHYKTAAGYLFYLVQEGILELVLAGDASTMQASRYRYLKEL